ncbi:MAG: cbb3-type cytochrome c oxidase subunit I [Ilumatobacteraceae bacterium]
MTAIETAAPSAGSAGAGLAAVADWVTTTDHKRIGRLYIGVSGLLLVAAAAVSALLSLERVDIDRQLVDINSLTQLFALARTGLLYLGLAPMLVGVAIAVVPLQLGSRSLTFPRLAAGGFWLWLFGAVLAIYSLLLNGGPGGGNPRFVDLYMLSMVLIIVGLVAGALSVAATVLTSRSPGMSLRRVPFFSWSALISSLGILIALPVLGGYLLVLYLAHKYPSLSELSGNRSVSEWAAFGFTQPATLLFAIPVLGLLLDVAATAVRRRPTQRGAALAAVAIAGTAMIGPMLQWPVVVRDGVADLGAGQVVNDLLPFGLVHGLPLLGVLGVIAAAARSLRTKPALSAPLVAGLLGGLLVLLAAAASAANHIGDLGLVGTVFEEGALLAVVYGGTVSAMGAIAYWGPKWWGRTMPPVVSGLLVALAGIGGALASVSMLVAGLLDQPGAVFPTVEVGADAVVYFPDADGPLALLNGVSLLGHLAVLVAAVVFAVVALQSFRSGSVAGDDPWDGQTLEWATTSPAPADNFAEVHVVRSAEPLLDLKTRSDA